MIRAALFAITIGLVAGLALTNAQTRAADAVVNPMMEY